MHVRFRVVLLLGAMLHAAPVSADDETAKALAAIKAISREGKGNDNAAPAWKTLVTQGVPALLPTLEAMSDDNPTAANYFRTAVDAITENELAAGRKLPADKLEAFATNPKFSATGRRLAYELLTTQDATAKARLLPRFLDDKSPELRREAIDRELELIERTTTPATTLARLEKLFTYARDKDQIDFLAKKVQQNGGKANITEHFAFVTCASLVGPFDAPESKGFTTQYPPDSAKDITGKFRGKEDAEIKWQTFNTSEKYGTFDLNKLLGKHKNAVVYALVVLVAEQETPCEIRVTSPTSVKIFLNQKELFGRDEYHHGAAFDANTGRGTLMKGENVLVLKVCQNNQTDSWAQAWQFQMRVCDGTGGALPGVKQLPQTGEKPVQLGFIETPAKEEK
jgi:hypothetical protein